PQTALSDDNKLGQGGFGVVYKGTLPDGRRIAIKRLTTQSQKGKQEFLNEVKLVSSVQHRNLVKLYGCCTEESERLLVYELLENNSLSRVLFQDAGLNTVPPSFDKEQAIRVICVGLLCTQATPSQRPSMSRVVTMICGEAKLGKVSRPAMVELVDGVLKADTLNSSYSSQELHSSQCISSAR
ncbi:hypothetical protein SELMODRAFT_432635, partial [Selaginella moellendorffii]